MSPLAKVEIRRRTSRQSALQVLEDLVRGQTDAYEGYRRLYLLWCSNHAALPELKPLFRIPGIDPDGRIAADTRFRAQVMSLAEKILERFPERQAPD